MMMKTSALFLLLLLMAAASPVKGSVIFSENFDGYSSLTSGSQASTGLTVYHSGTVSGWSNAGLNSAHAVLRSTGDYALQLFSGATFNGPTSPNVLTQMTSIDANASGTEYFVTFDAAPTVWSNPSQATASGDGILIEILRSDDSVLSSHIQQPGAWAGTQNSFSPGSFSYFGDGTGNVRIRLSESPTLSDRFGGAIDNLVVSSVPEPSRTLLLFSGAVLLALLRTRQRP